MGQPEFFHLRLENFFHRKIRIAKIYCFRKIPQNFHLRFTKRLLYDDKVRFTIIVAYLFSTIVLTVLFSSRFTSQSSLEYSFAPKQSCACTKNFTDRNLHILQI